MRAISRHIEHVLVAQIEVLGTAGDATRCPDTGAGRGVAISELSELPCRGQLNLSEPVHHMATYRCYLTLLENLHRTWVARDEKWQLFCLVQDPAGRRNRHCSA